MGSGGSRLGARPHRPARSRTVKRALSSLFICGASSSQLPLDHQIGDHSAKLLVSSGKQIRTNTVTTPRKDTIAGLTCSKIEIGVSSSGTVVEDGQSNVPEDIPSNSNGSYAGKSFIENDYENKDVVAPSRIGGHSCHSTQDDQPFPTSPCRTESMDDSEIDSTMDDEGSPVFAVSTQFTSPSPGILDSPSTEDLLGDHADELTMFSDCDSATVSVIMDSPVTSNSSRDDLFLQTAPSCPELLVSERERHWRHRSMLHVDSENLSSSSSIERRVHESRLNDRRLFWDAFSRRSPGSFADSRNYVFSNDDLDDLGSQEIWPRDLGGGSFSNRVGVNYRSHQSQTQSRGYNDEHHLRSEILERLGETIASDHTTSNCPAGIHLNGTCMCESILMANESGSRASISRIVMLAEALFEVLDEIHQQPMTLPLSMPSLPAPESTVDSLPIKNHIKKDGPSDGNDVTNCYICLAEYEEGDKIRVLPCHHEFHMLCVDKWLKEIHGVCPLCRGDVQQGFV
ncbi:unnamed protein product [Cuscuta campestris]|uniref:RING-type domain-containing protein n=1 Tax=Cuscuta campestris TaxID=132261 RepID=A0A484MGR2_9ASTE|nr:unnamed protein product [Cuscuta campestris]